MQQVCTGVMLHGYPLVKNLCAELQAFMAQHDFSSISDFCGASLPFFTTHRELVPSPGHLSRVLSSLSAMLVRGGVLWFRLISSAWWRQPEHDLQSELVIA